MGCVTTFNDKTFLRILSFAFSFFILTNENRICSVSHNRAWRGVRGKGASLDPGQRRAPLHGVSSRVHGGET